MEWDARYHLLKLFHRWPLILLVFGLGAGLGWLISLIIPATYRAEADLGVYYQSDAIFRNVDDYKNWEMEQLQVAIFSDDILGETQKQLLINDRYWKDKTIADIRSMVHVYWRNAGVWHLVAEAPKPNYARQLVETWKSVILEKVGGALTKSSDWLRINADLQMASRAKLEGLARQAALTQMQQVFSQWIESSHEHGESPLNPQERWRFYDLAARLAEQNSAGKELLDQFPASDALATQYIPWIEQALGVIESELGLLQAQIPILDENINRNSQKLTEWVNASWGLSAYIHLDSLNAEVKPAQPIRSSPLIALVGGIIALLVASVIWLALTERGNSH